MDIIAITLLLLNSIAIGDIDFTPNNNKAPYIQNAAQECMDVFERGAMRAYQDKGEDALHGSSFRLQ